MSHLVRIVSDLVVTLPDSGICRFCSPMPSSPHTASALCAWYVPARMEGKLTRMEGKLSSGLDVQVLVPHQARNAQKRAL
jgi:hypothetical protein